MYQYMLLLLLLPIGVTGQGSKPVGPIISDDYIKLITQPVVVNRLPLSPDTINNFHHANTTLQRDFNSYLLIKKIAICNNKMRIENSRLTRLAIGGSYGSMVEIKTINCLPALQNNYVQGSAQNGATGWRGAETNELFSYGPAIQTLEFDGSNYLYDHNGRLAATGTGNGNRAVAYNNNIFRTATLFSQSFNLQGILYVDNLARYNFNLRLAETNEQTFIRANQNKSKNMTATIGALLWKHINISASYHYRQHQFTNSNRNGFLNRLYQNASLTPISFSNAQGSIVGAAQRSYSQFADNPEFLLSDNGNSFFQSQQNAGLAIEKQGRNFNFKIAPSYEKVEQLWKEAYKPGTAYFANGISTKRRAMDQSFLLKANASHRFNFANGNFRSVATANYILHVAHSTIRYSSPNTQYLYQRTSSDMSLGFLTTYQHRKIYAGIDLTNKGYLSSTAIKQNFFLPGATAFTRFDNVFDKLSIKLTGSFIRFNSELPVNKSYSYANLLRYTTRQSLQYFPLQEVNSFANLLPIQHSEWTGRLELWYKNRFSFTTELFVRNTAQDIFPVYENNQLLLKNITAHQNKGIELQLSQVDWLSNNPAFSTSNSISFIAYKNRVTAAADGYNYTPVAGFSNVHKAIVKGEAFGAIVGSSFLRDGNKNIIIGTDGFPLVNNQLKVIGNPIPDFIMKLNNSFRWKQFSLSLDWEWQKGGDRWNGTQAALDYYGRSQQTAALRGTNNYIFEGVLQNGHVNNIPVSFYNPALPVESNRWVRYGVSGVAEAYIEKADQLRLNTAAVTYKIQFKKYIQRITLSAYVNNILLWSAYKGADSNQLLYDQQASAGLDFFNLPATKTFGFNLQIQF